MPKNKKKHLIVTDITIGADALEGSKTIMFCDYIIAETNETGTFQYELLDKMEEWYEIDWELSFRNCNKV